MWFLAGTFGGRAERICQIPSGRAIFFPIINDIISFATDPHLKTGEELRKYAKKDLDNVKFLSARLDGIEIGNLECYRVQTSMFEIKLPNGQSGDLLPTKAISEGYWIFLSPLSIGKHKIEFKGEKLAFDEITDFKSDHLPKFNTEVIYDITIV